MNRWNLLDKYSDISNSSNTIFFLGALLTLLTLGISNFDLLCVSNKGYGQGINEKIFFRFLMEEVN